MADQKEAITMADGSITSKVIVGGARTMFMVPPAAVVTGNYIQLEATTGHIQLEDGSGAILLES